MQLLVPPVMLSRETLSFDVTGDMLTEHVPYIDDFCRACGADLKIRRIVVDDIPCEAALRYILGSLVWEAGSCDSPMLRSHMDLFKISKEDQARLAEAYCEGLEPEVLYVHCGLENVELGGITEDGTYLYLKKAPSNP